MQHPSKTFAITFLEWHEGIRIKNEKCAKQTLVMPQHKLWRPQTTRLSTNPRKSNLFSHFAKPAKREFHLSCDTSLIVLQIKFHNFPNQSGHTAIQTCALSLHPLAGFPADLCLGCTLRAFRVNPQEEPASRRNSLLVLLLHQWYSQPQKIQNRT